MLSIFGDLDLFNESMMVKRDCVRKPLKKWYEPDYAGWSEYSILSDLFAQMPTVTTDKETGERTTSVSFDVPGLTAKDVKVTFDKETWTLALTGKSGAKSYDYRISTFSDDLLIETLSTTVENGVATISGKLRNKEKEVKKQSSTVDIPVK